MRKLPKSISRQDISERIVYFREKVVNLTQVEFAARVGVSLRALQTYEHCKADASTEFCKRAYDAFGLDPLWLLTGQGTAEVKIGRSGNKPQIQVAYEAVNQALAETRTQVTEDQKGRLFQAVYEQLLKANGEIRKVDIRMMIGLIA